MKLKDKVAIVTGAGAGMGRAVAIRYAKEGAKVVIAEISEHPGNETLALIKELAGEAIFVPVNVGDENQVSQLVSTVIDKYGRIDVLYNNVAKMHKQDAKVHELSTEVWNDLINVNMNSAFFCCKYVITEMLKTGGGSIIIVGSPTALVACASSDTAYSCSKSGVHALARVIAGAYGKDNIRANIIIPGTMNTPMIEELIKDEKVKKDLENAAMLGRLGESNDIDGLAVFLASADSSYCTGAFFTADGGLTAL
jgi:NAD(P)-dependent dehydrogenase (short-subunit alcohol dehydrogenase family)